MVSLLVRNMATGIENLKIYKMAEELEIRAYKNTLNFPREEKYTSANQIRRSSASVCNNIAESYHKSSIKEKIHILEIAKGEAEETRTNILRCGKKKFIDEKEADFISEKYIELLKAFNGFIKFLKTKK